jgi:hypothetical protein
MLYGFVPADRHDEILGDLIEEWQADARNPARNLVFWFRCLHLSVEYLVALGWLRQAATLRATASVRVKNKGDRLDHMRGHRV